MILIFWVDFLINVLFQNILYISFILIEPEVLINISGSSYGIADCLLEKYTCDSFYKIAF